MVGSFSEEVFTLRYFTSGLIVMPCNSTANTSDHHFGIFVEPQIREIPPPHNHAPHMNIFATVNVT
jgi:hypothetical protein